MKRQTHSKTSLFLMEILLTVLFFSIASAICIQFFVKAHFISLDSKELSHGTVLCENAAEIYRSGDGSLSSLLSIYPDAVMDGNTMLIYFDSSFVRSDFSDSSYCLEVDYACDNANCYADIFNIFKTVRRRKILRSFFQIKVSIIIWSKFNPGNSFFIGCPDNADFTIC